MLLVVTLLCIVPAGVVFARLEHVSLKQVADESEAAAEDQMGMKHPTEQNSR
jgi:hypothetical protein